jgi:hypothetical protein
VVHFKLNPGSLVNLKDAGKAEPIGPAAINVASVQFLVIASCFAEAIRYV